ncbi:YigZ family protein [Ureaplasma sp. ES3154-GEN]|uniref:YigZ family protein n=1 Tax=Ureaplasma sp. ES3154-GEN TaxID=2984844 RepID=UPI0021E7D76E|nr:YigZ family protein [Ureaplasma sp. ES3154-GEN]MCV3743282.1 YigZ family protein [Ureaplasma sp. ES3154-GEN]
MPNYKTIKQYQTIKYNINKSNFYAFIYPVHNANDIDQHLNELRTKYYDATHIVYAYVFNKQTTIITKAFDDQEPKNSAGAVILNNLLKYNLMNNLICIVRYFGKVKLGLSNLKNVYKKMSEQIINNSILDEYVILYDYQIKVLLTNMKTFNIFHNQHPNLIIKQKTCLDDMLVVDCQIDEILEEIQSDSWEIRKII